MLLQNNISWPDLYFTAEAEKEDFEDISIVSLKSLFSEKVHELAINDVGVEDEALVRARVHEIIKSGTVFVEEHVNVSGSGITVYVDVDAIDDNTMWEALTMISSALETLDGKHGDVPIGKSITYSLSDIPWLYTH